MIDEQLLASLGLHDLDMDALVGSAVGKKTENAGYMDSMLTEQVEDLSPGKLIKGTIIGYAGDDVVVEVGLKSEGLIAKEEFEGIDIKIGDQIDVLLEELEGEDGVIQLSKRKADRMLSWQRIVDTQKEGDVVEGMVTKKIKGGLLVDIGVPVFLPASQVDIRRPSEIGDLIGKKVRAEILKIDLERRNIVISRRKLIETERDVAKKRLLETLKEGQNVVGTVKNIADFGAFVDLGGIDGLLHITDMSWGRINHPSEILKIDQKIEVRVLNIDREKEKIALGLKQKEASPWEEIEKKYPVGSRVHGAVVNIMSYGAFVKLEDGIEGLVHISEMTWNKRIKHPSKLVNQGDLVEAKVIGVDADEKRISLSMKELEMNPWDLVEERYPVGSIVRGKVRNITDFGIFVGIEEGIDGLVHISDLSW
jgi:small subunit ribosomal protein S1